MPRYSRIVINPQIYVSTLGCYHVEFLYDDRQQDGRRMIGSYRVRVGFETSKGFITKMPAYVAQEVKQQIIMAHQAGQLKFQERTTDLHCPAMWEALVQAL